MARGLVEFSECCPPWRFSPAVFRLPSFFRARVHGSVRGADPKKAASDALRHVTTRDAIASPAAAEPRDSYLGLQDVLPRSSKPFTILRALRPVALITWMPPPSNAIRRPSGDQDGFSPQSWSCRRPLPSRLTTKIPPETKRLPRSKTIFRPCGDQSGLLPLRANLRSLDPSGLTAQSAVPRSKMIRRPLGAHVGPPYAIGPPVAAASRRW
jgi:hypothetical protein